MKTRRQFLIKAQLGVLAAASAGLSVSNPDQAFAQTSPPTVPATPATPATPGAPPTFGTLPAFGPEVGAVTFAEAEKLTQVTMTAAEREMAANSWRTSMAAMLERRSGPRKVTLEASVSPATQWNPVLPGMKVGPLRDKFIRSQSDGAPLPKNDDDIAFAPVSKLSRWIETKALTSERLTRIYLERIKRFDAKLRCIITLTAEHALTQARQADQEIAAALGEEILAQEKVKREREIKIPKPRKFKTHSEKKASKNNPIGKK